MKMKTHDMTNPGGATLGRREFLRSAVAGCAALVWAPSGWTDNSAGCAGLVFHDQNGSGRPGGGNPGIGGVRVSNGRDIVVTDDTGRWSLPLLGERTVVFVIKPSGWRTRLSPDHIPVFHAAHDPAGSPYMNYRGIDPTGGLPASIDFGLLRADEPAEFMALICGDPQPRDEREIGYLARSAVPDLAAQAGAAFGVSLGDIMFDNLDLFESLNAAMKATGIPWYNVIGNHDLNFDAPDPPRAVDSFLRVYGPDYYAFEYGPVHFLVLNTVVWYRDPDRPRGGNYRGGLGPRQLEFIRNELAHVPKDRLTVMLMHVPLYSGDDSVRHFVEDRQTLYRLIEDRPNLVSFSAHRHRHDHFFLGESDGWRGARPLHHIVTGTLCGSWFRGAPDETGIPHATMSDGTPRGYLRVRFSDGRYDIDGYASIGRDAGDQMRIDAPESVAPGAIGETLVHVNVFNGSERSTVRMRIGPASAWRPMERVERNDPFFERLHERDRNLEAPYYPLSRPQPCSHLWAASPPAGLPEGLHAIEIEADDGFGHLHRGSRSLRVSEG